MHYRALGRTGLETSIVGLGTEYLAGTSPENIANVIGAALDAGVNYIDVVFAYPEYRDALAAALRGGRDRVLLAGHLGSAYTEKRRKPSRDAGAPGHGVARMDELREYRRTRSVKESLDLIEDQLERFATDHVDVLFLHNVNDVEEYRALCKPKGLLEIARRLVGEGKARAIGMSCHDPAAAQLAVDEGAIQVLMFPINVATQAQQGYRELLQACLRRGVGVVAMKPFAGGKLLQARVDVRAAGNAGAGADQKEGQPLTPVQCLSYVLVQPAVSTAVPGVKDVDELAAALAFLDAPAEARYFGSALGEFQQYEAGVCTYCNHCLPCPAGIDIGAVGRLIDIAEAGARDGAVIEYARLMARASACNACGGCVDRCPFGVRVIQMMERAAELFEKDTR